ncbi:hypothetical protein KND94_001980 [Staphylococcus pseudintermedius]|uniref:hypothetical protein n=1 Tax=Staphylococcus pseudintermedius TaxID=283734 RepID=UPI001A0CB5C8|nr:hypothetical protein [Staphylococcus pseudintermedius]HEC2174165.1 hypothetical protein [Staphylococcus delphini]EGQ3392019.1 hypothetical protein [Staphylococcus pseudintermedius]EGQ3597038.1 hypothetical protein [Staphylococcus pseudintermedius]EHP0490889.1 hypothetical protein [Staphylococcus pseudintermedius]EIA5751653.1 hypothetical protein [Staphylococcus pseudintermedius]
MKPTQNDINKLKKQVQQIMKINGIDHNTWLYEQYQNYLSDNTEIITRALKELSEKQNSNTTSNNNIENTID